MVTGEFGSGDQCGVLGSAQMAQLIRFCQYEQPSCLWGLDLRSLFSEILDKDLLEPLWERYRFLSDQFENLIEFLKVLLGYEGPTCESLLDFWILG